MLDLRFQRADHVGRGLSSANPAGCLLLLPFTVDAEGRGLSSWSFRRPGLGATPLGLATESVRLSEGVSHAHGIMPFSVRTPGIHVHGVVTDVPSQLLASDPNFSSEQ